MKPKDWKILRFAAGILGLPVFFAPNICITRWFQTCFYLHQLCWGKFAPLWRCSHIFQMGWSETQPPTSHTWLFLVEALLVWVSSSSQTFRQSSVSDYEFPKFSRDPKHKKQSLARWWFPLFGEESHVDYYFSNGLETTNQSLAWILFLGQFAPSYSVHFKNLVVLNLFTKNYRSCPRI